MRVRPSVGQLRSWMFMGASRGTCFRRVGKGAERAVPTRPELRWARFALPTLLQLHISGLDHLVPALDLGAHEGRGLRRRAADRLGRKVGEALAHAAVLDRR